MSTGGGRREVAFRLFAAEYDDADFDYRESDEERAPNYVVTPAGARANRLFVAGVLTAVEQVNEDMLRGRISDPTGAFVVYAGQYQPDAEAFLDRTEPPEYVAVTGKARTFRPDDSDRVFTSLRPESVTAVDGETRDRWTVVAAEHTLARVATMAVALRRPERGGDLRDWLAERGAQPGVAAGVPLAVDHYGTTPAYLAALRERALQAAEVVAGDRDQVDSLDVAPGESGDADVEALADPEVAGLNVDGETATETTGSSGDAASGGDAASSDGAASAGDMASSDGAASAASEDATAEGADGEGAASEGVEDATDSEATATAGDGGATAATDPEDGSGTADGEAEAAADETASTGDEATDDAPADVEGGGERYEMDDEERERIESELGTDFATAGEVDEPGSADIDVPDNGPEEDDAAAETDGAASGTDGTEGEESDDEADDGDELEDAAVEAMRDLDEGGGAPREAVVERVGEEMSVDEAAVEDAIQDALMDGRCYEPDDETLKPI